MAKANPDVLKKKLNRIDEEIEKLQKQRIEVKDQLSNIYFCDHCNTYQNEMIFKDIHRWGKVTEDQNYGTGISATCLCTNCGSERKINFTSSWRGSCKDDKDFDDVVYETTELTNRNDLVDRWWRGEWDEVRSGK